MELNAFIGVGLFIIAIGIGLYYFTREKKIQVKSVSFAFSLISEDDADDRYFNTDDRVILWYDSSRGKDALNRLYHADFDLTESPYDGYYTDGKIMLSIENGYQEQRYITGI